MQRWKARHDNVNVYMVYDEEQMAVHFKIVWPTDGHVVERDVPFHSYDITALTAEQLTTDELEAMYILGGGYK